MMGAERVFADTNLFLRYLTNDVPERADVVERLLRRAASGDTILVINSMVVAEVVWTLESFYGLPRNEIREHVMAIVNTPGLELADQDIMLQAVSWYAEKNVDFIDAYNAAWLLAQGMEAIYTFDHEHFERLERVRIEVAE